MTLSLLNRGFVSFDRNMHSSLWKLPHLFVGKNFLYSYNIYNIDNYNIYNIDNIEHLYTVITFIIYITYIYFSLVTVLSSSDTRTIKRDELTKLDKNVITDI